MLRKMPGYTMVTFWDHEWSSLKLTDPDLRDWLKRQEIVEPIAVRDCLYGGRTNALILYHLCKPNEKIKYYDVRVFIVWIVSRMLKYELFILKVTSLYPFVQKYKRYPCGHPCIITENFDDDFDSYFGIAKCTILPLEEFGSTGAKSLGWRSNTGVTHCTLKGITYNYLTSLKLNFETIKQIVFNNQRDVNVPQLKFCRVKNTFEVYTEIQDKNYRYTYDKRILLPNFQTIPYGFIGI
jgi:hypothetical protein